MNNRRLTAEQAATIAARSVCPACDGRDADGTEESYASCIFCATGTRKPVLPDGLDAISDAATQTRRPTPLAPVLPLRGTAPATAFALDDESLALD